MESGLQQQASEILDLVSRAKKVFGGDSVPERPPAFAPPGDLEEAISRDCF
ncbi:hypothetical protein [Mycobacterium lehmannii]|uniref:hypothetical protein n=1 Tax=Mycobacterium lehmannii TaxID=2048550 RepID=UPI0013044DDE|nr:hypothetical protein [Mycobacterium lehmannii]